MDKFPQKSLPIGLSDFKSLIEKCYFVDKSKFIAEILEHEGTQVTLITRPRRFGKTLMLSMLNYFFNLDDAEKNKHLFQGLSIEKSHHFKRQGTSPVIFLSFKDIVDNNILDLSQTLSTHISILYKKYTYLLDSLNINKFDKEYFEIICKQQGSLSQVKIALKELTRFLSTHHQKNTLVLIDEYDAPIINAWKNKYYDAAIELMRSIYSSVLKDNIYLDIAVITGVARIAKESIFSGLNNLEICSVFNDEYSDIFGFEEREIKNMMNYYGLIEKFANVKEWYDG
ncbi:MAG: AAA family ATPase, partial [Desulfovibrionaceae bacterium]|nr:AAA family ATPase [Desulfovibrionaceae bacterium]